MSRPGPSRGDRAGFRYPTRTRSLRATVSAPSPPPEAARGSPWPTSPPHPTPQALSPGCRPCALHLLKNPDGGGSPLISAGVGGRHLVLKVPREPGEGRAGSGWPPVAGDEVVDRFSSRSAATFQLQRSCDERHGGGRRRLPIQARRTGGHPHHHEPPPSRQHDAHNQGVEPATRVTRALVVAPVARPIHRRYRAAG